MEVADEVEAVVSVPHRETHPRRADQGRVGPGVAAEIRVGEVPDVTPSGGTVKSATVSRDGRHWFISFLVQDGLTRVEHHLHLDAHAGVDRGVVTAAVTSDGEFFDRRHAGTGSLSSLVPPPECKQDRQPDLGFLTPGEAERYLRLQRRLARSKKGSRQREHVVAAMGDIMRRVRWRRADFNAQAAHRLTRRYAIVVLENLNIDGMTTSVRRRPAGTPSTPTSSGRRTRWSDIGRPGWSFQGVETHPGP
ncbi:transposase [Nonomuraea sp. NPDC048901]|uniref:transposase n=1 Tax=Nonomuraea sp. NPDC048901 TaxID=3155627 RepID=UPI0033E5D07B